MLLELKNVSYVYGKGLSEETWALKDINLEIKEHEFTAIVGHTGSGKSTLVQLFNGLFRPTEGEVFFRGENIFEKGFDRKALRGKVGLVFQYPERQLFESTVQKDVEFGPKNMGFDKLKVQMNTFQALSDVGIESDLFDSAPWELSGGQMRRVAIAGVLATEPEVLVLDEPMAGMDPAGRAQMIALLKQWQEKRNLTVILVTHNMEDVAECAKRVVVLNRGNIVLDGDPRRVFQYEKELKSIGLGVPQATGLLLALKANGADVRTDCLTAPEAAAAIREWLSKS